MTITNQMIADYQDRTGRILYPGQVERLLINAFAYRESLIREKIQYAATQNLVDFADAPFLDYLGQLVGVTRLAASPASVMIQFNLDPDHGGVIIPAGTRIGTVSGSLIFATTEDTIVPAIDSLINIECVCTTAGSEGNQFGPFTVSTVLDPYPYLISAFNTTNSGGGASQESDNALRERIKLAPGSFSNAGSYEAYVFYARSASASIIDVNVQGPPLQPPGEVHIFPLMENGDITPSTVLDEVSAAVNDEKIRPLTDLVIVATPTRFDYSIDVEVTILTTADPISTEETITSNLNAYALARRQKLGLDIKLQQILTNAFIQGLVYEVNIISPSADMVMAENEFGFCTGVNVTITGTNNG